MSVKFIVGVDASLRNVGVTVMDNTGKRVDSFNIVTANGTPDHASVDKIVGDFFEKLEEYLTPELIKNRAVAFFFEDIMFGRTGKATARSEVAGVLKWCIRFEGLNVFGVPPKMANSFLDGRFGLKSTRRSSKVQKKHTMDVLNRHCNFYTRNDNIADSYVMALVGYAYLIEKQRLGVRALCRVKF